MKSIPQIIITYNKYTIRPRPSGLGEIDGLHGTSTQSCILTYDLCTGEPLRRPKPAQDEWYVIMSGHPFIKALAAYWGGAFVQGLRCHFFSMPGKSPMKLEVTSRHDHSCLLGRKASKQTKTNARLLPFNINKRCTSGVLSREFTEEANTEITENLSYDLISIGRILKQT